MWNPFFWKIRLHSCPSRFFCWLPHADYRPIKDKCKSTDLQFTKTNFNIKEIVYFWLYKDTLLFKEVWWYDYVYLTCFSKVSTPLKKQKYCPWLNAIKHKKKQQKSVVLYIQTFMGGRIKMCIFIRYFLCIFIQYNLYWDLKISIMCAYKSIHIRGFPGGCLQ